MRKGFLDKLASKKEKRIKKKEKGKTLKNIKHQL